MGLFSLCAGRPRGVDFGGRTPGRREVADVEQREAASKGRPGGSRGPCWGLGAVMTRRGEGSILVRAPEPVKPAAGEVKPPAAAALDSEGVPNRVPATRDQHPSPASEPATKSALPRVLVSTVTPVYRGAETLRELASRLDAVRRRWDEEDWPFQLVESIFVDDASVDDSAAVLARLEAEYDFVRVVTLSRNFGQHPATAGGILHTSGDWVLTLDEDLQHRPEDVDALLERATTRGLDVVYARPSGEVHRSWYRDRASSAYKRLLSISTGDPNVRLFNSFRAVRGSIARAAAAVARHDTYLDIAIGWFTQRIGSRALRLLDPRQGAYSFRGLLSHARRAMISSQTKWLRLGALVGLGGLSLSLVLLAWILVQKLRVAGVDRGAGLGVAFPHHRLLRRTGGVPGRRGAGIPADAGAGSPRQAEFLRRRPLARRRAERFFERHPSGMPSGDALSDRAED